MLPTWYGCDPKKQVYYTWKEQVKILFESVIIISGFIGGFALYMKICEAFVWLMN